MDEIIVYILFAFIPVSSIFLCLMSDDNRNRRVTLNALLLANALLFLSPLIYAFVATFPGGNMWSENGAGAALWFYFFLVPICFVVELVLMILKLSFRKKT